MNCYDSSIFLIRMHGYLDLTLLPMTTLSIPRVDPHNTVSWLRVCSTSFTLAAIVRRF